MLEKYEMSNVQKRIYTIEMLVGKMNTVYNVSSFFYIKGDLKLDKLENAFTQLVKRHEILRTQFDEIKGEFYQIICENIQFKLEIENANKSEMHDKCKSFIQPFDIKKAPLFRVKILNLSNNEFIIMFDIHHIIFDGGSEPIVVKEIIELYKGIELPAVKYHYKTFSAWQRRLDLSKQKNYWLSEFENGIPILNLRTDYFRKQKQSFAGSNLTIEIEKEIKDKTKTFIKKNRVTEFMLMLSVFILMLHKYTRQDEIVIGTPTSGRTHSNVQNMIGMFVNSLAIKGEMSQTMSFKELLVHIKEKCLMAFANQDFQFDELVQSLNVRRDLSRNPIFDVMFGYSNLTKKTDLKFGNLEVQSMFIEQKVSKFDITLIVTETEEGYIANFEYCTDLFKPETIDLMAKHYVKLLENVLENPIMKLEEISMLDESETKAVIQGFNQTDVEYPRDNTVLELFEEQVRNTPDRTAVVFGNKKFTYAELNARANSLARKLRTEYNVKPDDFVAIITERSMEMMEGLLAIVKAGGAYVPIDTTYPEDRIAFILKDCKPKAILTGPGEFKLPSDIKSINLSDETNYTASIENPERINVASDLIYMIYTSGTTGNPKGTAVINRNVVRLVKNTNYIRLDEQTRVLQTGAVSFDASTLEIWGPMLNGGSLYLYDKEVLTDSAQLKKEIAEKEINTLWLTAALYNQMVEADHSMFKPLRYLLVGGEKLSEPHIRMLDREGSNVKIINGYGPTENTTFTTTYEIPEDFENIPIGKPINNTKVYILNQNELCGIGVPGELCITGDGVARGYLNRPELNTEKFVKNPFGEGKMYRSGDLVRWLIDGNIEYLGRMDEQIKIRGFRIELGEIESKIHEIEEIRETAVIAREDDNDSKYLCAYIVSDQKIDAKEVKKKLRKELPDYMIPTYIMQIEALPVSRNGKLDRRALPEPEYQSTTEYVAARNSVEELIVTAYESIFGIKKVSVTDNFFDLGGDSIKAIRVLSKIKEAGYQSSVKAIMNEQTPENIAKITMKESNMIKAEQKEVTGEVNLTAIQKDFFERRLSKPGHFNQSLLYESAERIDIIALHKTLKKLVEHHDMLRAVYQNGVQSIGSVHEKQWYDYYEYETSVDGINELADQMQGSIDIEQGPLMKVGVFHTMEKDYVLFVIHHLVVDGISWRILSEDIGNGYRQAKSGAEITFPEKTTSFKEWSKQIRSYRNSYTLKKEEEYWRKINQDIESGKIEKDIGKVEGERKTNISTFTLGKEYTRNLLQNSNNSYNTKINDLMLAALVRAVNQVTGQSCVAVEMEGHGREEICKEMSVERTIGWFTSAYPVVIKKIGQGIRQDIRNAKETLHRVPNNGIGYGILKNISESIFEREVEPDITFNYLGEFGAESEQGTVMFKISNLEHGRDIDSENRYGTPISINAAVQDQILSVGITYDESKYKAKTLENLCSKFKKELTAVVEHCIQTESTEYTAVDYGEIEWTEEEFQVAKEKLKAKGKEIERIYPLTAMQEGMLFEKLADEDSTQYVIQQAMKMKELNIENMRVAFASVVDKYDILHTVIKYKEVSIARQVLLKERKPEFEYTEVASEEEYQAIKRKDVKRGFDLEEDTLIRMQAVKVSNEDYRLIVTNHHIIADGWCLSILYGDLFRYYQMLEKGTKIPKEQVEHYEKFVRYIEAKDKESSLAYWEKLLEDYEEQAEILPIGKIENTDVECIKTSISLSKKITQEAVKLSAKYGVTVNTIVEAIWGILLSRYNRTNDVVFGKVISGRNADIPGIEDMIGLFINTIPVRVKTQKGDTFLKLIQELQKQAIAGNEHDYCPLAEIQNNSALGNGLIGTLMAFENYYVQEMDSKDINRSLQQTIEFESIREQTNYGITLSASIGETLNIAIEYDADRYGKDDAGLLLDHLQTLIENAVNNPEAELEEISMINRVEFEKVVTMFNNTDVPYPKDRTIIQLFEEQVSKTSDKTSVVYGNQKLTFAELNARANHLAGKLRNEYKVKPDDFVAIITDRCLEMVVGILAIIKAGGAYVPLDPQYPKERKKFILEDCKPKVILQGLGNVELETSIEKVNLRKTANYLNTEENLEHINKAGDLIYMIYTSGTTGKPKGTMIEHRSAVNLVSHVISSRKINENSVIMQKTSNVFDVSVWEIFSPLLSGGKIVLLKNGDEKDPEKIVKEIEKNQVTELSFVPSMFKAFVSVIKENDKRLNSLVGIQLAGEALPAELVISYKGPGEIVNFYGPTEDTVYATEYVCKKDDTKIPIGKPIQNAQTYILNENKLCGIGVPGELCIAGDGVARGYLNRPNLNAEKFVKNPFGEGKMYRSGDLVRWLPDGNIEYLGRIDEQVKIRGFRVELGEIENRLHELDEIKAVAVIAREDQDGEKYLCAYVVAEKEIDVNKLKDELRSKIPAYMVPSSIIQIEEIPVTRNGKLDRKALPDTKYQKVSEYAAPRNSLEETVVTAFEEVLGVEHIGIYDSFFDLGGHSLKATKLGNELEKTCGVRITIHDIFTASTPELIVEKIKAAEKEEYKDIIPVETADSYVMSSAQKRIYMLDVMMGASIHYNIPSCLRMKGDIDTHRLQQALNQLIQREEVFRTSFHMENGKPVQKIVKMVEIEIEYSEVEKADIQEIFKEFVRPFDLSKAPLARVKVVKTQEDYILFYDIHHIISDGASMPIMMKEIMDLYEGKELPSLRVQYKDFSVWQNKRNIESQAEYWKNEFAGELPVLDLKTDYVRSQEQSFHGASIGKQIEKETKQRIKELAKKHRATEFMVMLSAFMVMLQKYSRQEDIIVGTPISGRVHADTHKMLGMFVNTLALRGEVYKEQSFSELLERMKNKCLKAYDNQEYQFEELVEAVNVQRDMSRNPLFDVMFVLQNNEKTVVKAREVSIEGVPVDHIIAKFDITLAVTEIEEGYVVDFDYCTDLFKPETIDLMAKHYVTLLENILKHPDKKLEQISMLDETEEDIVVRKFNSTIVKYEKDKTVAELFEEQVTNVPDKVAVVFENDQLTYAELNNKANSLARKLRKEYDIKPDDFVAIIAERSIEMIVGIFAIIKAGGAYVPIDPLYPKDRIDFMLEDCKPKVLLIAISEFIENENIPTLDLYDKKNYTETVENPDRINKATDLLYLIYTSGTTGKPKGVMVENKGIHNLINLFSDSFRIDSTHIVGMFHNYIFDGSVWEIMMGLLTGSRLVVLNEEQTHDLNELKNVIQREKIDIIALPPQYAVQIKIQGVKVLITAGSEASKEVLENVENEYINSYGPTENTISATYWKYRKGETVPAKIPIGKPAPNVSIYILNGKELCGIGVTGELCIAGDGVSRGYLNRPELTEEKFVKNPYGEGMMYRSGDLARWLFDGNIEYLGRMDEQVKIRGFRIELAEIQNSIYEMKGIIENVVIAREDTNGDKYLCAYVVSDQKVESKKIKKELRKTLPDYMIPTYIMQMETIPVTRNGKPDIRALPEPEYQNNTEYVAARNPVEEIIVKAFESILGVKKVSITDSFFDLGGDSIKAIRVAGKIKEAGYQTSIKAIMSEQMPENIAKITKKDFDMVKAEQDEVTGMVKLMAIQKEFFDSNLINPGHFNQSFLYESRERIDIVALHEVMKKLVEHHDMLRAVYQQGLQRIESIIAKEQWYDFYEYDCSTDGINELAGQIQTSINLEQGPLMKIGLFHTLEKDYVLFVIHHLVVDGVSWRILSEDLENGYRQVIEGEEIVFPKKTTSFKEWSEEICRYRNSYRLKKEETYWKKVNQGIITGKIAKDAKETEGKSKPNIIAFVMDKEYTSDLLKKCNKAYNTEINDLMLTGLVRAVNKVTRQNSVAVQMEGHGREEINKQVSIERTVGWFTSSYPVVFQNIGKTIGEDIRNAKETLHRIPEKGIGYGILKTIGEPVFESFMEPDIAFNYMGEFGEEQDGRETNFVISNLAHGVNIDQNNKFGSSISINGGVQDGVLSIGISYEESEYKAETIKKLCSQFKKELIAIVDQCKMVENTEYSAVDFGEKEWSEEEFQAVKEKLEAKGEQIERIYPLTAMQEGMLFEKLANEESAQYVIQHIMKFNKLNTEHIQAAFEALVEKHDILHTVIKYKGQKKARQILLKERKPEFLYVEVNSEEEYQKIKRNDVKRGFDLEEDTLIRMQVVKVSDEDYRLIVTKHHIIVDGWCLSILYGDLFRYYELLQTGVKIPKEVSGKYEEFVRYIEEKDKEQSLTYWEKLLEGYEDQAEIPPIKMLENAEDECLNANISLSMEMTKEAETLSAKFGVTVNTLVEAVWGILLQKYNRTNDVVFGKVVSGRNADVDGIEQMIGLFINTIPVRVETEHEDTFQDLISKLQKQAIAGNEHDYCPLAEIQSRSALGNGLIGTLMAFENYYIQELESKSSNNSQEIIAEFESMREQTNYGITLSANIAETLNFEIKYNTSKYGKAEVEHLLQHLKTLMENAIQNPVAKIEELKMINLAETEMIMKMFNDTDAEYPKDKTIVQLFEEQVTKTKDKVAVVCEGKQLTYEELNAKANSLARKLRTEYNVKPDDFVAMITERSIEMIVGIYAIIKAGAAYVPIDPTYPKDRKEFTLADCNAKALLLAVKENDIETEVPILDLYDEKSYTESKRNLEMVNSPNDLLYVIYTSGTTGKPKGVMIEHENLVRLIHNSKFQFDFNEEDVWTLFHSYCFDFSVWEIFASTLYGGKLVIVPKETAKDTFSFSELLEKEKVTILNQVPSSFYNLIDITDNKTISSIRYVIFGGEALSPNKLQKWHENNKQCKIINMYGITETTVHVTYRNIDNKEIRNGISDIGSAIPTLSVYVMNGNELCGIGVPGELCVTGAGVARGYLNRPELTAKKFVRNPYGEGNMYRSGDLARWLPDGNIEYLGRIDEQVKIRGFRIEIGEIASRINEIKGIKAATVIAREDKTSGKYLCAYVVAEEEIDVNRIKDMLRKTIPGYMIPAYIMQIESIPVTRNGKLDRKALPEPKYQKVTEYEAPRNSLEELVVNAFEEVLGREHIGIHDSFFELGGHSLLATKLSNELEKTSGFRVTIQDIFTTSTPELIAEKIKDTGIVEYENIMPTKKADSYAMSSAQKRLYMLDKMMEGSIQYNIPNILKIKGNLDLNRLQEALNQLLMRQEAFRTSFHMENAEPVQKIANQVEMEIQYSEETKADISKLFLAFVRPFDLSQAPLARVKVVKTEEDYILFYDIHHIISDGESMSVMLEEIIALYKGKKLPELRVQYKDFSAWQNQRNIENQAEYWKNEFSGEIPVLDLKTDYVRMQEQSFHGANIESLIEKEIKEKVKELARENKATEFMVMLSAFMVMLQKYSRQEDIIVGTPISGRIHADTHKMLGMFVNTLALKGEVHPNKSFSELLKELKNKCLKAYDNQEYQFEELVEAVNVQRDMSRNPLFDVMFILQNNMKAEVKTTEVAIEGVPFDYTVSKFDITLAVTETEEGYTTDFEYCTDLFKVETIEIMAKHYSTLLKNILENPDKKLKEISMLDEVEEENVVKIFNDTVTEYKKDKTVVELFEEQVNKTADKVAVVFGNEQLTYAEFNAKANRLARKLRTKYEVKANDFVAIIADRSLESLVGIYAIIKAGGAYVPLDPAYPKERIEFILKDCMPKAILKGEGDFEIPAGFIQVELLDELNYADSSKNLEHVNTVSDLIYMIYTSGTTGKPKGTMIEHRNAVNLLTHVIRTRNLNENSVILQKTSNVFDVSVWEIFAPLLCGGRNILLKNGDEKDPELIAKAIEKNQVTELSFVPSMFKAFVSEMKENDPRLKSLIGIQVAGEALPPELVSSYKGPGEIINFYGPTEDTVYATEYVCCKKDIIIPIGKPISNTQTYILLGEELCGIGVPGELCIAGDGISRGYLNRPKLTEEKFVLNPYGEGRMYRSGDLVRWLPDGNIEYLGRMDEQVKIRGFRIELGEIESRMHEIQEIKEVAVIAKETPDGGKFLCAYVVSDQEIDVYAIRDELHKKMPSYMIPGSIMQIESIPVTRNGKLDKKALPEPEYQGTSEYVAARNAVEETIVKAFEAILGVKKVSITDAFFDLGGDSIKAIRVSGKMKEAGYHTSVKAILSEQKPENIAKVTKKDFGVIKAEQGEVVGEVNLMPIQKDFFESRLYSPGHFNQSFLYECTERIDNVALHKTLKKLIEHHDILRAIYQDGIQRIESIDTKQWYDFYEYDSSKEEINELANQIQIGIDIEQGPLMKAGLFHTPEKDYVLLIIHHLVVDGISWRILSEDMENGYRKAKAGEEITLPKKTTSFKEWSEEIVRYKNSYRLKKEENYWNKVIKESRLGNLFKDGHKGQRKQGVSAFTLEKEHTIDLLKNSNKAYHTEINDLMLVALARAVNQVTKQSNIAIKMEGHGREEISSEVSIERTVGWFTTTYPVVFCNIGQEIGMDIRNVKETLHRVPNKGIGYGILARIGEPELEIAVEPDITFNYLGEFGSENLALDSIFVISQLPHGLDIDLANRFGTSITINGAVQNGILSMGITYDESDYNAETIKMLCFEFKAQLTAVANHCKQAMTTEYTASDYGETEWTENEYQGTKEKLEAKGEEIVRIYPLTAMQEGMLFEKLANEESTQYVIQQAMKVNRINIEHMQKAFEKVVDKHDILHTVIRYKEVKIPRQVLIKERKPEFNYIEVSNEDEYQEIKKNDVIRGFDLEEDTLIRMLIVRVSENDYRLILTNHHIIADGWCISILYGDLFQYYQMFENGYQIKDKQVGNFEEFVRYIGAKDKEESLKYWKKLLEDYEEQAVILPIGTAKNSNEESMRIGISLSNEISQKVVKLCADNGVTVNTLVEAAWGILIQRYNRTNDVVFGKVVSGRNAEVEGIETMIGLFINTIPVRVQTEYGDTFKTLLQKLQYQAVSGNEYDYCPLAEIQSQSVLGNALIGTIMAFENYYVQELEQIDWEIKAEMESAREQTNYVISLSANMGETLNLGIMYNPRIYGKDEIELILEHLQILIVNAVSNPNTEIEELKMCASEEEKKVITLFNESDSEYPRDKTIIEIFEEQVLLAPNKTAVVYDNKKFTYAEFNEKANTLAHKLRKIGVKPNDFVAIIMENSIEMLISIMGILKSGGSYVPLDATYPEERIQYILRDCKPKAVVVNEKNINIDVQIIDIADINEWEESVENPNIINKPEDLAYCIYTSGTTGKPKGVMIEHTGVLNLREYFITKQKIKPTDHILQFANFTFDATVSEMCMSILSGATMYMVTKEIQNDIRSFEAFVEENEISVAILPPQYLSQIHLKNLRTIITAGSETNKMLVEANRDIPIYSNDYGPTEVTVCATYWRHNKSNEVPSRIPIGKPINNKKVYILSGERICEIGVPGEICIAGVGLARGYLNMPDLTAQKFSDNPFGEGKMYRTGDLGRWLPDGNIDYLGRIDEQVKIRGFRIELGEIESRLYEMEEIKEVVVTALKDKNGDKYICAYVVSDEEISSDKIKDALSYKIPNYMIPAYIMQVKEIPLTRSGKLDKYALPEPIYQKKNEYIAPRTSSEEIITKAFQEVLGLNKVSVTDSFFDLGGDSIKAIRVVSYINDDRVNVRTILNERTPERIATKIEKDQTEEIMYLMNQNIAKDNLKPNIFMIASIEGYASIFNQIVNDMNYKGDVYGLNDPKFYVSDINNLQNSLGYTINTIYKEINKVFKDGDILVGYSYGAKLLPLITYLLEHSGKKVSKIFVLDTIINQSVSGIIGEKEMFDLAKLYVKRYLGREYNAKEFGITVSSILKKIAEITSNNKKENFESVYHELKCAYDVHISNNRNNIIFKSKIQADIMAVFSNTTMKSEPEKCYEWESYTNGNFEYQLYDCEHSEIVKEKSKQVSEFMMNHIDSYGI